MVSKSCKCIYCVHSSSSVWYGVAGLLMFLFSVLIACYRRTGPTPDHVRHLPPVDHLFTWARHHQNNHNHSHHPHMSGQPTTSDTLIAEASCPREYHREIRNRISPTSAQCCVAANTVLYLTNLMAASLKRINTTTTIFTPAQQHE